MGRRIGYIPTNMVNTLPTDVYNHKPCNIEIKQQIELLSYPPAIILSIPSSSIHLACVLKTCILRTMLNTTIIKIVTFCIEVEMIIRFEIDEKYLESWKIIVGYGTLVLSLGSMPKEAFISIQLEMSKFINTDLSVAVSSS
ncbi:hypothetical protein LOAG_05283 [Loa loa]|uniref:Uncharacterized protein n=1 Tax=Loa loa TaxID=7209 RepID=A0A1S0U0J6_LOALO|nr:hypothetical protein LOAG_05283 [Loa loa]EFO23202.1 hypothetical protein LOAG_05283 [Loa loa]